MGHATAGPGGTLRAGSGSTALAALPVDVGAAHLADLLAPRAVGAQVAVFDPDLDPDGRHARLLVETLAEGLGELGRAR